MTAQDAKYVVEPPDVVALPVVGSAARFPVRRVYCIGRNYASHAREMGHDPDRELPFYFQKNPDNLDTSGTFPYPAKTQDVHHELELAVVLQSGGTSIPMADASQCVYGYAVALDMTRRDLQAEQKTLGRPWEIGKAFEHSLPIGPVHPAATTGTLERGRIALWVNDSLTQDGDLAQMIWSVPELISYLSDYVTLVAGDIILTGTPAGVGPVQRGDVMRAEIAGLDGLKVSVC